MKLAIVSAVWKRHDIFEMFARGVHELEKIKGLEIKKKRNMICIS